MNYTLRVTDNKQVSVSENNIVNELLKQKGTLLILYYTIASWLLTNRITAKLRTVIQLGCRRGNSDGCGYYNNGGGGGSRGGRSGYV